MAKEENDDRFSRFGTVSFAAVTHVNDFVDYLEKGRLMGTKCRQCGRLFFPPRADCFHSLASDMEWFEVSGPGKLLTYSTLKYAPTGFSDELPYTIAVVEFQGFKVFGRIDRSVPVEGLEVGAAMKAVVVKTPNDRFTYAFKKA
jgi:uncharacterized OB-fold protein